MSYDGSSHSICQIVLDELNQLSDDAWLVRLLTSLQGFHRTSPLTLMLERLVPAGPITSSIPYEKILEAANGASYTRTKRADLWTWCDDHRPTRGQVIQVLERAVASCE